jgi:hypothetical protein
MGNSESAPQRQLAAAERQLWASHIILSPLDMTAPSNQQLADYEGYATAYDTDGVLAVRLKVSGEAYTNWGFSFELNAESGISVMRQSVLVMTNSLEQAGVEIADLEFVGAHLSTFKALRLETKNRAALGIDQTVSITDETFKATDALRRHAHDSFYVTRNRAAAIAGFDNSYLTFPQEPNLRQNPRSLVNTHLN